MKLVKGCTFVVDINIFKISESVKAIVNCSW
jgi:hypothetical protein